MSTPYKDVVVFIPGILGSTLAKGNAPIWGTRLSTILKTATIGLDELSVSQVGSLKSDLRDGVSVTGLTSNIELVPGFWKLGGYSRISNALGSLPGLIRGLNYFDFPYDWRRDNRVAALRLREQAEHWLQNWTRETRHKDAKLVFVVHSMGGLVARHYMECLEGWRSTRMLIAIGSPFRGSGNALNFLVNGAAFPAPFGGLSSRFDSLREMDSLFQLLPTYRFVRKQFGELQRLVDADYLPIDRDRVREGRAFHEEIEKAETDNHTIENYRMSARRIRTVIGINQPTIQSAFWDGSELCTQSEWNGNDDGGDNVVPRPSATPLSGSEDFAMFTTNSHAVMSADETVLSHIKGLLSSHDLDLTKFRKHSSCSLSLQVDDIAVAENPIPISVKVFGLPQSSVIVEMVRDGEVATRVHLKSIDENTFFGEATIPAGTYLVRASAKNAPEVADVIAVLG